jgi:ArsR family transcriptional regulator
LPADTLLAAIRAAGEPTRLRILVLLGEGELTVKDLTVILGQSQPRISRHLKLLAEAGLVERHPEGAWVYYRLVEEGPLRRLVRTLTETVDAADIGLARDHERLASLRREQAEQAARYFAENAAAWDELRSLHVAEDAVERAMLGAIGETPFRAFLDLGTGTGRLLTLLEPLYDRGLGIDASSDMLSVARANLAKAGTTKARVMLGDINQLSLPRESFDLVAIHQVLHYLAEPSRAVAEAARVLRPGGRLLIVDFAPHELEFLRERHAHRRLGFDSASVRQWLEAAGLIVEAVEDLVPDGQGGHLTVTLWLARDPRLLIAADFNKERLA